MADMLQADLDTLHRLGDTLADHADAIGKIKISVSVVMPDSPLQNVGARIGDAVIGAFGLIGRNIREMADASKAAAKTYEENDRVYADQLARYTRGG
ncbi:hypothetical protein ACFYTQ_13590 [Nocardia sp. NPDC004068]|uniref:hypothetical protein n=1 Tax=Nocardia sp. NPDC004068 TaxID=3364303 RepID=UPI0036CA63DB